jgi:hypothetical protein
LRAGDWVEVRSKDEILRSLDKNGRLEELPFMPQMFEYCGKRFKVFKRAHKTCDTVNPVRGRRLADAVHLNLRCDGKAYGGCQAACLLFWKEAWLRPVNEEKKPPGPEPLREIQRNDRHIANEHCSEKDVWRGTCVQPDLPVMDTRYTCQATLLPDYTTTLQWWDLRQYVEDYTSGNVTLGAILRGLVYAGYYHFSLAKRGRLGHPARWLYDRVQALWSGVPYPRRRGTLPIGTPTPTCTLNLRAGELVRVKSYREILATLDTASKNRGMLFDAELVPYCGGTYRVRTRVERFIDEKTGRMISLKTPAVILEDVWCRSRYSNCRMFCPRAIYSWWREIWLQRVDGGTIR